MSDFNDISYVGRLWCPELIPDIEKFLPVAIFKMATAIPHKFNIVRFIIYPHIKFWWYRTMLNFCGIVVAILKIVTGRNCSMSGINSGHHNLPTYEMSLDMWVDYDVPNWFLISKNFYRLPFSKWLPQYRTNSTLFDFNVLNWFLISKNFSKVAFNLFFKPVISARIEINGHPWINIGRRRRSI
jgi:hypothetical protein